MQHKMKSAYGVQLLRKISTYTWKDLDEILFLAAKLYVYVYYMYLYMYMYICICLCILYVYVHIYIYIYTHMLVYAASHGNFLWYD